jgi:purine-nucleoside phosphorylase
MGIWYERAAEAAEYISKRIERESGSIPRPEFSLVLGTCFGEAADNAEDTVCIPYGDIPHFTKSTVGGHAGRLLYCKMGGRPGFVMQGRTHYYEGYESSAVALPIRVFSLLGAPLLILTNAAGSINPAYRVGDFVVITDHIAFFAESPLRGPNEDAFGLRFPSMDNIYDAELVKIAEQCGRDMGLNMHRGVYAYMKGPQFETHAEIRALKVLGADLVGMSTVYEAITAGHCGMKLLGISCVTNMAAGISEKPVSHEDVSHTEERVRRDFTPYINRLIEIIK